MARNCEPSTALTSLHALHTEMLIRKQNIDRLRHATL